MDAVLNGLNDATYHGDIEIVKRLINDGKNVIGKGWDGDAPLLNAIQGEHKKTVILLLDAGAEINNDFVQGAFYKTNMEILINLFSYGEKYFCNQAST